MIVNGHNLVVVVVILADHSRIQVEERASLAREVKFLLVEEPLHKGAEVEEARTVVVAP